MQLKIKNKWLNRILSRKSDFNDPDIFFFNFKSANKFGIFSFNFQTGNKMPESILIIQSFLIQHFIQILEVKAIQTESISISYQ